MPANTGIAEQDRKRIAQGLSRLLADSYLLYLKTHNFHWNVEGPKFKALHDLFEEQYQDLAQAVDDIAERVRTLGEYAPGSYAQFAELASIKEETGHPDADAMVRQLADDQVTVAERARGVLKDAQEAGDEGSVDLLGGRVMTHEKNAWMLHSMLA